MAIIPGNANCVGGQLHDDPRCTAALIRRNM
jgi:hypothetical protein